MSILRGLTLHFGKVTVLMELRRLAKIVLDYSEYWIIVDLTKVTGTRIRSFADRSVISLPRHAECKSKCFTHLKVIDDCVSLSRPNIKLLWRSAEESERRKLNLLGVSGCSRTIVSLHNLSNPVIAKSFQEGLAVSHSEHHDVEP